MIHAKEIGFQSAWQELTPGGEIYEGGTSVQTITGEWRVNRPVFHPEKCKQCLLRFGKPAQDGQHRLRSGRPGLFCGRY